MPSARPATFHETGLTDSSVKERPGNPSFRLRQGRIYDARPFGPALRRQLFPAPGGGFRQVVERKVIAMPKLSRVAVVLVAISSASVLLQTQSGRLATAPSASAATGGITFETPSIADPIHTFGEPDIGIDSQGRVFVSGPTGTGTQRSVWVGSVDGGHSFRTISPGPPPSALLGTEAPPGGGDTDINFDRSSKQYFIDLYALTCNRVATTADGGATAAQNVLGCGTGFGSDRPWLAVYDPPPGSPHQSAYAGPTPLVYEVYNNLVSGSQWNKSLDRLNYEAATNADQSGTTLITPAD